MYLQNSKLHGYLELNFRLEAGVVAGTISMYVSLIKFIYSEKATKF